MSALGHLESSHLIISAESNLPRKEPRSNVPLLEHLIEDTESSQLYSKLVPSLENIILVDNSAGRLDLNSFQNLTPFPSIMSHNPADGCTLTRQNLSPDEIVNIQFTSGTTAMPKAACLNHRSILNNGAQIADRMLLTPKDIVCCPPPLFHCFGSVLGYMATATHGSSIVFPSEAFNARAALNAVQEEQCTALYGVPTMFLEELGLIEKGEVSAEGFQHLRTGIAAGSSIPAELMKKLHRVLNLTELTICYGMTETSPVSAMTTTDDPIDKRINTVGRLMPHVEAKIVHPVNKTSVVPIESRGELAVSGYLLMQGYWGDAEKTAEVMIKDETGKVWMHVSLLTKPFPVLFQFQSLERWTDLTDRTDWRRSIHVTRWIHHHHGSDKRPDYSGRREHPPPGSRKLSACAPGNRRRIHCRSSRRAIWRGSRCICDSSREQSADRHHRGYPGMGAGKAKQSSRYAVSSERRITFIDRVFDSS